MISFSEPMDKASVQAAWQSPGLPASAVTFGWDDTGTILTVTPNEPLVIAEIVALEESAQAYGYSINTAATDLAGNSLEQDYEVVFTTARRWTTSIFVDTNMSKFVASNGDVGGEGFATMAINRVGDNANNQGIRSFVSFPLADLPADLIELESAQMDVLEGWNQTGFPLVADANGLGEMKVHDVEFDEILSTTFNLELGVEAGTLMKFPSGATPVDVTDLVLADLDAAATYSQFRLAFTKNSDGNGVADFIGIQDDHLPIEVVVLIP